MPRSLMPLSWPALSVTLWLTAGCGGAQHGAEDESVATEERIQSEALPIPGEDEGAEELSSDADSTDIEGQPTSIACEVDVDHPNVTRQLATFMRWLRDQSVGRRVTIDAVSPQCGDRGGFLVIEAQLSGPAGGLDSLGRALALYYPESTWNVTTYERLEGEDVPLRVVVELRIPAGASPRPRCTWDAAVPCP